MNNAATAIMKSAKLTYIMLVIPDCKATIPTLNGAITPPTSYAISSTPNNSPYKLPLTCLLMKISRGITISVIPMAVSTKQTESPKSDLSTRKTVWPSKVKAAPKASILVSLNLLAIFPVMGENKT